MDFTSFLCLLTKLKENQLDGRVAHSLLAPPNRMEQLRSIQITKMKPKKASVMLLFYPNAVGEVSFVLTRRKKYNGAHSEQISFPGGKPESSDDDLWETALRETHEEIGIASAQVKYLRSLTQLYVPPSNFLIVPYLGYLENPCFFSPDPYEVDDVLEISLESLINNKPIVIKLPSSSLTSIEVPAYVFDQNVVWGATAMILSEFKMLFTAGLSK